MSSDGKPSLSASSGRPGSPGPLGYPVRFPDGRVGWGDPGRVETAIRDCGATPIEPAALAWWLEEQSVPLSIAVDLATGTPRWRQELGLLDPYIGRAWTGPYVAEIDIRPLLEHQGATPLAQDLFGRANRALHQKPDWLAEEIIWKRLHTYYDPLQNAQVRYVKPLPFAWWAYKSFSEVRDAMPVEWRAAIEKFVGSGSTVQDQAIGSCRGESASENMPLSEPSARSLVVFKVEASPTPKVTSDTFEQPPESPKIGWVLCVDRRVRVDGSPFSREEGLAGRKREIQKPSPNDVAALRAVFEAFEKSGTASDASIAPYAEANNQASLRGLRSRLQAWTRGYLSLRDGKSYKIFPEKRLTAVFSSETSIAP